MSADLTILSLACPGFSVAPRCRDPIALTRVVGRTVGRLVRRAHPVVYAALALTGSRTLARLVGLRATASDEMPGGSKRYEVLLLGKSLGHFRFRDC